MQFLILGFDGVDEHAPARRAAARDEHLAIVSEMKENGHALYAAALLASDGSMNGSALIVEFDDQEKLEAWLRNEPYITEDVWRQIKVFPCKVAPSFAK